MRALADAEAEQGDVEVYVKTGGCSLACTEIERVNRIGPASGPAGRWDGSWGGRAPLVIEASAE